MIGILILFLDTLYNFLTFLIIMEDSLSKILKKALTFHFISDFLS